MAITKFSDFQKGQNSKSGIKSFKDFISNTDSEPLSLKSNDGLGFNKPTPEPPIDFIGNNERLIGGAQKMVQQAIARGAEQQKAKEEQKKSSHEQFRDSLPPLLQKYTDWYEKHIAGTKVSKALNALDRADEAVGAAKSGFLDTASLGLTNFAGRKAIDNLPDAEKLNQMLNERKESTPYKVGEFAGYLPPGVAADRLVVKLGGDALKNAPKLVHGLIRGSAAGALDTAAQETGDVALRGETFDPVNIALGTGLGGVLGSLAPAVSGTAKYIGNKALNPFVNNVLKQYEVIDNVSRQELPDSVRRVVSREKVPEVFPERFRRTIWPKETPVSEPRVSEPTVSEPPLQPTSSPSTIREPEIPTAGQTSKKYTPEQESALKSIDDELDAFRKENRQRHANSDAAGREYLDKQLKGRMAAASAKRREVVQGDSLIYVEGGLTPKELERKIKYLKSDYVGKEVYVDGVKGKIKGNSFGKVGVEFPDGTVKYVQSSDLTPVHDIDAIAAKQASDKTPKPDPTSPTEPRTTEPTPSPRGTTTIEQLRGERSNYGTQVREGNFPEEFNRGVAARDRSYDVITDEASVARANEAINDVDSATSKFLGNKEFSKDHVTTGYRLLQELNRMGDTEKALNVADKLAEDLTNAGQTVQAASVLKRLSPEGQLLHLQRQASAAGKTVSEADAKVYTELASEVQQGVHNGAETRAFMETLDSLKAGRPVSSEEFQRAADILKDAEKYLKNNAEFPKAIRDAKVRDKVVSFLDDVETNALARIAARRNNLNSLPVGEWADHALVVSAQIAKGTIKAANYVEQMVKMFGEEIRPHAKQIYDEAKRLLGVTARNINEGKLRDAQETIERLRTSQTPAGKVAEKFIRESEIKPGDVEKLRDLARQLNSLRGASAQEADMQMQAILNRYQKASWWDRTQALRYIGMLFNTGTQSINAISGPIMATTGYAADIAGVLMDMAYSAIKNQPRTTTLYGSNPLKFMARWFKNLSPGAKAGYMGVSPHGIMGANDIRGLAFKGTPWNETTLRGKIGGTLAMPLSGLERSLGAVAKGADYATYKSVYQSEMDKLGYLDAKRSGIKGRKEIKAHIEKFLLDPPDSAIEQADKIAKRTTFQRKDTLGGKAANFLNSAPTGVKQVTNTIFPFVRTPVNIASAAVDLSPAGIIKGLVELSRNGGSEAARRDAIRTLGLSLVGGGGLSATGYYLSQIGIVNGANESGDKNVDAVREQAGKGKFRFNSSAMGRYLDAMIGGKGLKAAENAAKYQKGDKQFDYNKLQPLAFPVALGASLNETKGDVMKSGQDAAASLFGMSTLKGIQDIFQPQFGGTSGEKTTGVGKRLVESFFKSFSPSLLAQEANRRDPVVRDIPYNADIWTDLKGYFMSRTPELSKRLPEKVTNLGDTKLKSSGFTGAYLNPYRSEQAAYNPAATIISDLIEQTGDKGLAPKPFDKSVDGRDSVTGQPVTKEIPKARYTQLEKQVGQIESKMIQKLPDNLTPEQKAYLIKKIYNFVRGAARQSVKKELGIIVE